MVNVLVFCLHKYYRFYAEEKTNTCTSIDNRCMAQEKEEEKKCNRNAALPMVIKKSDDDIINRFSLTGKISPLATVKEIYIDTFFLCQT